MKPYSQILVIDDDPSNREAISLLLTSIGYQVQSASSGEEALELLQKNSFEVILTDLFLPGISGIDILKKVKEDAPSSCVILITGKASAETAVEAMKSGAFDYLTKPLHLERLKVVIAKALEKTQLLSENLYLRQQLRGKYRFDKIIGNSLAMQQVFSRMEKIVATDSTILILGDSGTGKELVAKAIHFNGNRKDKPFVAINCGAIPAELLESELFGHIKGSFTGAVADKKGKFEQANHGTIFLDEIATMPLHLQIKLLRVLQEHEVEKVGDNKIIKLDVRVISATNAHLEDSVKRGTFREDLYYRLNVIPIKLPALKERREDIALLARHFVTKICQESDRTPATFSNEAMRAMEAYPWPGNVRELENVVERTITLSDGNVIELADLPTDFGQTDADSRESAVACPKVTEQGVDMPQFVASIERDLIQSALALANGVKARAANLLNIKRTTLVEKIKRLRIEA
ncbi:MAG: sigma-54 dependent transcriptional regulator [Desulfuromonadaceae bacterium]|nr:sigma-54 dependent transcriptional regulator [Desulfuromonadaceae bacterium]